LNLADYKYERLKYNYMRILIILILTGMATKAQYGIGLYLYGIIFTVLKSY
jgi:hypothetical protein